MPGGSKAKMIRSAYELFRVRGYSGTGFREVSAHSGVTRGSIYHHFPRGKSELAEDVVALADDEVTAALGGVASAPGAGAEAVVAAFVEGWARHVASHGFAAGCAVVAVAGELGPADDRLAASVAAAFGNWSGLIADALRREGVGADRAHRVATLVVAAVEGAVVLCRAERSRRPLEDVGEELRGLVRAATGGQPETPAT